MIETGKFNELEFIRKTDGGLILGGPDKEDVLLPWAEAPETVEPGDIFHVFVFRHSDGRLMATSKTPHACVGEFACLTAVDQNETGAFLDLGIGKDVFVSERDQKRPMRIGGRYVVYIFRDEHSGRIMGSSKLNYYVNQEDLDLEPGDEVSLLISDESDLGYSAIINQKHLGLIYRNEVYEDLKPGESRKGYIKKIREGNLIDLSLQPIGFKHILDTKDSMMLILKENNGVLDLGDKSSPEDIYSRLKISKKVFKKTIGGLYKERLIEISDHQIKLIPGADKKR